MNILKIIAGLSVGTLLCAAAAMAEVGAQNRTSGATFTPCPSKATLLSQSIQSDTVTPCVAIVIFHPNVLQPEQKGIVGNKGAQFRAGLPLINGTAVYVPNDDALSGLLHDPRVLDIRPDGRVSIQGPPGSCTPWPECKNGDGGGDGGGSSAQVDPAGYLRIGANAVAATGAGIGVAIVDTGVDQDHADIDGNLAAPCFTAYTSCDDDNGHGTHVAGIVAAENNDQDIVGVAPEATIYAVKVLDSSGSGLFSDVLSGLQWVYNLNSAVPETSPVPIQVVNMSLGAEAVCGRPDDPGLYTYIQTLADQGVVVVVAPGNDSSKEVFDMLPAGCPGVLAIASTTAQAGTNKCKVLSGYVGADTASYFTTDGAFDGTVGVTISAPGETYENNTCGTIQSKGILSLAAGGGTTEKNGTSMAAPHVAGVAALMLQANGALSPFTVRSIIRASASNVESAPIDHPFISESLDGELEGIVNAPGAVAMAAGL